ncbi:hypothetical protein N7532_004392 [Penicillium argentinense]|uniref:Uncharacterized protein n=1 Tax=Penicillium argentinense TaxID=1131581 RepID=A0A9W9FPE3_9EURO|nr:uncharacterized protein N7532_004392 [Penicillium argentinense]KAJ5103863.1 hypothetical protein N7532_004392 [Penicillium argentinense]
MQTFWLIPNLVTSVVSTAGGIIALINPSSLSGSKKVTDGELYYQRMYTARAIPLGILSGILPFYFQGPMTSSVLLAAAAVQAFDVAIGAGKGDQGMVVGASVATILHMTCFFSLK